MNLENIFKNLIKMEVLYMIFAIIYTVIFTEIEYVDPDAPLIWTIQDTLGALLGVVILVYITNLYFLYKFKPIGKTLYVPLIIIQILIVGFMAEPIEPSMSLYSASLVEWIAGLITGMVIALLYFTEIKDKFN
jgi:hypothetical protein